MDKQQIYDYLKREQIPHEITEHAAVYSMAELSGIPIAHPDSYAKNLFVRDDKKQNYYVITVKGDKRVDLKKFRQAGLTRPLSFASEGDLMEILGLRPGSVTPLGLLNDQESKVKLFIDRDFFDAPGPIGVHPNDNTATVWIKPEDLVRIIEKHGNPVQIVSI